MENNPHRPILLPIIGVVLLLFLVLIVYFFFQQKPLSKNNETINVTQTPQSVNTPEEKGSMILKTATPTIDNGAIITLTVIASSDNQNISGYDLALPFDATQVAYGKAESLIPDIDTQAREKNGKVYISGIKKLSVTKPVVLSNAPVLTITFTAQRKGKVVFTPEFLSGSTRESNIMSAESRPRDLLGKVEGVTVDVK